MPTIIPTPRKAGETISVRFATIFMKPREIPPYKQGGKPRQVYVYNVMPENGGEADEIEISSFEKDFVAQLDKYNPTPTDVCVITAIPKPGSQYTSLHLSIPEKGLGMDLPAMNTGGYQGESKAERAERNEKIGIQWALGQVLASDPSLLDNAAQQVAGPDDVQGLEIVASAKKTIMEKSLFLLNARDVIYAKRTIKAPTNQQPTNNENKREGENSFEDFSQ